MTNRTVYFKKHEFYFKRFSTVNYVFDGVTYEIMDFIHRWAFRDSIKNDAAAFSYWFIREQDSLFSMAEKLYNSQHYYWVIMMMNDIHDMYFDWPLSESDLHKYVKNKYGDENVYATHHLEADEFGDSIDALPEGTWITENYPSSFKTISNFEHETVLNEAKRKIKILKPEYLGQVKSEREKILISDFNRKRN